MITIKTPMCPLCGAGPLIVLGNVSQAFCPTPTCKVITWNPREGVDQIAEGTFIDLPDFGPME